jgi:hypothetical protein
MSKQQPEKATPEQKDQNIEIDDLSMMRLARIRSKAVSGLSRRPVAGTEHRGAGSPDRISTTAFPSHLFLDSGSLRKTLCRDDSSRLSFAYWWLSEKGSLARNAARLSRRSIIRLWPSALTNTSNNEHRRS